MTARMLKYRIHIASETTVLELRAGTTIRAVGVQQPKEICLWAEVPNDADLPAAARTFTIIGTGWDVPDPGTYLGTVFDGPFVWHVYEVTP